MSPFFAPASSSQVYHRFAVGMLLACLSACSGSSKTSVIGGPGGPPQPIVPTSSLGLAATSFDSTDGFVAFTVNEAEQGHSDLNGDGDARDLVLHVYNAITTQTFNLGFAVNVYATHGNTLAFGANEIEQGQDLNGDGDQLDSILHSYDMFNKTLINHKVALSVGGFGGRPPQLNLGFHGNCLVTRAHAEGQVASTIQILDPATGILSDTGFDSYHYSFGRGQSIVGFVSEPLLGQDLNSDGDFSDQVVHIYDPSSGMLTNTGVAAALSAYGPLYSSNEDILTIVVNEITNGNVDLDGDGQILGLILFVYDYATGLLQNTGLKIKSGPFFGLDLRIQGHHVVFLDYRNELVIWNGLSSTKYETGLYASGGVLTDQGLAISAYEALNSIDLNADGDQNDLILHYFDFASGMLHNLQVEACPKLESNGLILLTAFEISGMLDLNGDGDQHDILNFSLNQTTRELKLLQLPGIPIGTLNQDAVLSLALESEGDLNEDGDFDDEVILLGSSDPLRPAKSLGLARVFRNRAPKTLTTVFPFLVNESDQGNTDLNGDGDTLDEVLYILFEPQLID